MTGQMKPMYPSCSNMTAWLSLLGVAIASMALFSQTALAACPTPSNNTDDPIFAGQFGLTLIYDDGNDINNIYFCEQSFSNANLTFAVRPTELNNQFNEDASGDGTLAVPLGAANKTDSISISSTDISKVNNFSNIRFNNVTGDIPNAVGAEDGTRSLFNFYSDTRRRRNSTCTRSSVPDNEYRYVTQTLRNNAGLFFRARTGGTVRQAVSVNSGNTVARITNMPLENTSGQRILADITFVTETQRQYARRGRTDFNTWRNHLLCQVGVKAIITVKANQPDASPNAIRNAGEYSTNVYINSQF